MASRVGRTAGFGAAADCSASAMRSSASSSSSRMRLMLRCSGGRVSSAAGAMGPSVGWVTMAVTGQRGKGQL
ncbi:MAG TPA: hypothetical protein VNW54_10100 [Granulicella sp.]|nr:hypothetical protein [Granulicella sp.]